MDDDDEAAIHVRDERDGAAGILPHGEVRERRLLAVDCGRMIDREAGRVDRRARQK